MQCTWLRPLRCPGLVPHVFFAARHMHDLFYIGEFVAAWTLNEQPRMQVSEQWIQDNLRTATNPRGALYQGVICSSHFSHVGGGEEKKRGDNDDERTGPTSSAGPSGAALAAAAARMAITAKPTSSSTSTEDARRLSFVVRFND